MVYKHVDFQHLTPISEEVFTDLHEGNTRRLDIVMETKLKDQNTLLIIHIEPQSYIQPDFHERMYHYFSMLYNKYRKPIVPIAVFSYDDKRDKSNTFNMTFPFFHVLRFNFLTLQLRQKNWRDFIKSNNPVAAALLSKMGYTEKEKAQVKFEFLRMMSRMELNQAKMRFINGFFERYLSLNEKEEATVMEKVSKSPDMEKIMELPISYEEKGKEIGKKEVAASMLKEGFAIDDISKVTGLSHREIEKLQN
ncbi:Rpn family recombination-promoting nuclease/putative transposase [Virgibacillus sp. W0181]|uniref:Rpn family recombination-promoting nuclease/putative transposase n=1 Tax=Virgibacillus sp. W0181 TaxID=3391581 RepID=UPI003F4466CC